MSTAIPNELLTADSRYAPGIFKELVQLGTPGKVFAAINAVMAKVGAVEKSRKNTQQDYAYRGIDDVYAALQGLLAEHKLFVVPEVLDYECVERVSSNNKTLFFTRARIAHTFYSAEDGSSIRAVTLGEGMDSGDKASNKAMAVAMKYALTEVFCIPTYEPKDPEVDSHDIKPGEPKPEQPFDNERFKKLIRALAEVIGDDTVVAETLQKYGVVTTAEVNEPRKANMIYNEMKRLADRKKEADRLKRPR